MSQIKVKGIGMVYVDEDSAKMIDKMLSNENERKKNPYIRTKKWRGFLNDVSSVIIDQEVVYKKNNSLDEYIKWHKNYSKLSPEEKSKDLSLFKLYFQACNDDFERRLNITQDMCEKVKEIQRNFFEENPRRCFCDPLLFNEIVDPVKGKKISIWSRAIISLIENQIGQDMRSAKYEN